MAARDILALNNSLAPRLIRCLYIVALILIAVMVLLGVVRGVRVMTGPPLTPVVTTSSAPDASEPSMSRQDRMMGPRRMGERRFLMNRDLAGPRRFGPFGIGHNLVLTGGLFILGALVRGIIALMVVRILAEIGLAVLATPRRSDI